MVLRGGPRGRVGRRRTSFVEGRHRAGGRPSTHVRKLFLWCSGSHGCAGGRTCLVNSAAGAVVSRLPAVPGALQAPAARQVNGRAGQLAGPRAAVLPAAVPLVVVLRVVMLRVAGLRPAAVPPPDGDARTRDPQAADGAIRVATDRERGGATQHGPGALTGPRPARIGHVPDARMAPRPARMAPRPARMGRRRAMTGRVPGAPTRRNPAGKLPGPGMRTGPRPGVRMGHLPGVRTGHGSGVRTGRLPGVRTDPSPGVRMGRGGARRRRVRTMMRAGPARTCRGTARTGPGPGVVTARGPGAPSARGPAERRVGGLAGPTVRGLAGQRARDLVGPRRRGTGVLTARGTDGPPVHGLRAAPASHATEHGRPGSGPEDGSQAALERTPRRARPPGTGPGDVRRVIRRSRPTGGPCSVAPGPPPGVPCSVAAAPPRAERRETAPSGRPTRVATGPPTGR